MAVFCLIEVFDPPVSFVPVVNSVADTAVCCLRTDELALLTDVLAGAEDVLLTLVRPDDEAAVS